MSLPPAQENEGIILNLFVYRYSCRSRQLFGNARMKFLEYIQLSVLQQNLKGRVDINVLDVWYSSKPCSVSSSVERSSQDISCFRGTFSSVCSYWFLHCLGSPKVSTLDSGVQSTSQAPWRSGGFKLVHFSQDP